MSARGYDLSRYAAAALLLLYGFAKLNGSQFTSLESDLDTPMREVSGLALTWYYFGYSAVYGAILALVQIVGAIGLMVRRTALIAALVLFPVVGNIILIDVFYAIELGALLMALAIAAMLLRVLGEHKERLAALLLPPDGRRTPIFVHLLRVALVLFACGATYWIANVNNRLPTPIDGTWTVVQPPPDAPVKVYFERNRAWMCVFRYTRATARHHFEVDPRRRTVQIWETWRTKGRLLYRGTYDPAANRIDLTSPRNLTLVRDGV